MIENLRLAFKGIHSHRMRAILTMLGIVIGIASIIIIVSLINGTSEQLKNSMVNQGDDTITVTLCNKTDPWTIMDPVYAGCPDGVEEISSDIVEEIKSIDGVIGASPIYKSEYGVSVNYNGKNQSATVVGAEKDYFGLKNYVLSSGRYFIDRDYDERHNVAVISSGLANSMFENDSALGKTITLGTEMYTVVGVFSEVKDYDDIDTLMDYELKVGMESQNYIIVPSVSWVNFAGFKSYQVLVVKIASPDDTVNVGTQAADMLNMNVMSNTYEYRSSSLQEDAQYLETITNIISMLLIGIASISLIVGGIGVMNIMLVSVTERTKEIGLKKALGAKKRVILGQFLTESIVLTGMGGIVGVLLGIGISRLLSLLLQMPAATSVPAILIAVGFSMGIGIVFGITPSIKAANLNPIDALRYE